MIVNVPLDRITDNPFQPRRDYPDIHELADKIKDLKQELPATRGLIHPPNARLVNSAGAVLPVPAGGLPDATGDWAVQIAEGHRRLRAFRLLFGSDEDYAYMPVNLCELSDQVLDDVAWDENAARKDLSPVEEARALERSLAAFHLTQEQLAERRRLNRSTVSNKLRLLKLPDDLLEAIHQGQVSERVGMAYLSIMDIPEADLKYALLNNSPDFGVTWDTPTPEALRLRLLRYDERAPVTADMVRDIVERVKKEVEFEKKLRFEAKEREKAAPAPVPSKPAPDLRPIGPGPGQEDTESVPQPLPDVPQPLSMPPREVLLPDVVITIRLPRSKDPQPAKFTLSAGEDEQWPQFFQGKYPDDLNDVLQHALALFIPPIGEQVLMELEVSESE
jgi:ParB/RepB/Spo0J family partition protein